MIKHAKVSAFSDGADANQVRPSDWNAAHVIDGFAVPGLVSATSRVGTAVDQMVVMNGTGLTYTLPLAPAANQTLWLRNQDAGDLIVARNAQLINGVGADLTVSPGGTIVLWFCAAAPNVGWFVMS